MDVCDLHFEDTPRPGENVSTSIVTAAGQDVNYASSIACVALGRFSWPSEPGFARLDALISLIFNLISPAASQTACRGKSATRAADAVAASHSGG